MSKKSKDIPWYEPTRLPTAQSLHLLCLQRDGRIVVDVFEWWPDAEVWKNGHRIYSFGFETVLGWIPIHKVPLPKWVKRKGDE